MKLCFINSLATDNWTQSSALLFSPGLEVRGGKGSSNPITVWEVSLVTSRHPEGFPKSHFINMTKDTLITLCTWEIHRFGPLCVRNWEKDQIGIYFNSWSNTPYQKETQPGPPSNPKNSFSRTIPATVLWPCTEGHRVGEITWQRAPATSQREMICHRW